MQDVSPLPLPLISEEPPASPAPLPVFKRGYCGGRLDLDKLQNGRSMHSLALPFIKVGVGLAGWLGSRECLLAAFGPSPLQQQAAFSCSCFLLAS